MALYLIPTTRGYGGDMDVLFMIMYGGDSYADSQQRQTFFLCLQMAN